jgi:hypothetical protein
MMCLPLDSDYSFVARLVQAGMGENVLTEFLAGLLRDITIREAFVTGTLGLPVPTEVVSAASVRSEPEDATDRGIPDMELRSGDDLFILVENKLGAPFTANQPHQYMQSLMKWRQAHPHGIACLAIQAPERRLLALQEEAWRILAESFPEAKRSGSSFADVTVRFISWEHTASALKSIELRDPIVEYLCRSFLQILPLGLASVSRIITEEYRMRLSDIQTLEAVASLEDLLRDVRQRMSAAYTIKPSSDTSEFSYQGFEVKLKESDGRGVSVWVGISARFAARFHVTPLLVHLTGAVVGNMNSVRASGFTVIPRDDVVAGGWDDGPVVCLKVAPDMDPTTQADEVVRQIESIRRRALELE